MWIKPWTCQFCGKCFCNWGRLKHIGTQVPILVALKSEFDEFWTEDWPDFVILKFLSPSLIAMISPAPVPASASLEVELGTAQSQLVTVVQLHLMEYNHGLILYFSISPAQSHSVNTISQHSKLQSLKSILAQPHCTLR